MSDRCDYCDASKRMQAATREQARQVVGRVAAELRDVAPDHPLLVEAPICDRLVILIAEDGRHRTYPILAGETPRATYAVHGVVYQVAGVVTSEDVAL